MQQIALWHVTDDTLNKLAPASVDFEKHLEDWIERDPSLIQSGLTIVGRQFVVAAGRLDLLALDPQGRWTVVEIKPGPLYRETVAQALDYAACIAEMPYEELIRRARQHLQSHPGPAGDAPPADILEQTAEDAEASREIRVIVVGIGPVSGLERVVDFLSRSYSVPISTLSFRVFATPDGGKLLVRELAEPETSPAVPTTSPAQPRVTLESLCAQADSLGLGPSFRKVLAAATRHDLYPHLYTGSIMYTPPTMRNRCLFTTWANRQQPKKYAGLLGLWLSTDTFQEFFPVSLEEVTATLGPTGWRWLSTQEVDAFVAGLDSLFATINQRQHE